jgi:hypothetical protein
LSKSISISKSKLPSVNAQEEREKIPNSQPSAPYYVKMQTWNLDKPFQSKKQEFNGTGLQALSGGEREERYSTSSSESVNIEMGEVFERLASSQNRESSLNQKLSIMGTFECPV